MKRLVLLTQPEPDLQTRCATEQLRASLSGEYECIQRPVAPRTLLQTLGRFARAASACRDADLVHAWGLAALKVATFGAKCPILYTPLAEDGPQAARWLLSAQQKRTIRLACLSSADHKFMVENGVPEAHCHLLRPGVKLAKQTDRDTDLRRKLGLNDTDVAVLAMDQSLPHANHRLGLHATSILHFMNHRFRFLILGKGPELADVERLHDTWQVSCLVNATRILGDEVPFEQLIRAADLGLVTSGERASLQPLLSCMAGGLPLVAPANYAVSEILEDHHTALLFAKPTPRMIAQKILQMSEETELARKLADQARAEAYELFSPSQFTAEMRKVYAEAPALF